jgi:hypothetical protein
MGKNHERKIRYSVKLRKLVDLVGMGNCGSTDEKQDWKIKRFPSSSGADADVGNSESEVATTILHESAILDVDVQGELLGTCSDDKTVAVSSIPYLLSKGKYEPILLRSHLKAVNKIRFFQMENSVKLWSASRDLSIKLVSMLNFLINLSYRRFV